MRDECIGPSALFLLGQSIHCGDGPTGYSSKWSHASNPGRVINEDGATTALALRTAAILYRSNSQMVTKSPQQAPTIIVDVNVLAIELKPNDSFDVNTSDGDKPQHSRWRPQFRLRSKEWITICGTLIRSPDEVFSR